MGICHGLNDDPGPKGRCYSDTMLRGDGGMIIATTDKYKTITAKTPAVKGSVITILCFEEF
jgi:hypothetical protein